MVIGLEFENFFIPRYFPRPKDGEKIPIQVMDFQRMYGAWSPDLKATLYFEGGDEPLEAEGLKRVREITLLRVYDWLGEREGVIELSDDEFYNFEIVYSEFLRNCGEIQYSRKKVGRKTENIFELKERPYVVREVRNGIFSDKL